MALKYLLSELFLHPDSVPWRSFHPFYEVIMGHYPFGSRMMLHFDDDVAMLIRSFCVVPIHYLYTM